MKSREAEVLPSSVHIVNKFLKSDLLWADLIHSTVNLHSDTIFQISQDQPLQSDS